MNASPPPDDARPPHVDMTTAVAQTYNVTTSAVIRKVGVSWSGMRLVDWTGTNSNPRYYGLNGHGDLTWVADGTGAVTKRLRYTPWGELISSSGSPWPEWRFQGSWLDTATGLYWVVARWYAPALGRLVSEDSLIGNAPNPAGRHLYAYAGGDPIRRNDVSGLLYQDAKSVVEVFPIKNPGVRSKFRLSLFSFDRFVNLAIFTGRGDNQSFHPPGGCWRTKACVIVDYDNNLVKVIVRPSCGKWVVVGDWDCHDALPLDDKIGTFHPARNQFNIWELSGGKLAIDYSFHPSDAPNPLSAFVIDGHLLFRPGKSVDVGGDGFPAFEFYYVYPISGVVRTIVQRGPDPAGIAALAGLLGDRQQTYDWPPGPPRECKSAAGDDTSLLVATGCV
jgi:RHS repeat-associated protein